MTKKKINELDIGFLETYGEVKVYRTRVENTKAKIAIEFLSRWGMVAVEPDGEDSSGRQKVRIQSPADLVQRSCDTADLLINEFERRGWLLDVPPPANK